MSEDTRMENQYVYIHQMSPAESDYKNGLDFDKFVADHSSEGKGGLSVIVSETVPRYSYGMMIMREENGLTQKVGFHYSS